MLLLRLLQKIELLKDVASAEHMMQDMMLDFSSLSHFQTVFRKVTGEIPMAYRGHTTKKM